MLCLHQLFRKMVCDDKLLTQRSATSGLALKVFSLCIKKKKVAGKKKINWGQGHDHA